MSLQTSEPVRSFHMYSTVKSWNTVIILIRFKMRSLLVRWLAIGEPHGYADPLASRKVSRILDARTVECFNGCLELGSPCTC